MKKYFYMAVAAIAVLSSCNKTDALLDDNGNGVDNTNAPVFTATIESDATKTTLVEGSTAGKLTKVAWLKTDQVFIVTADEDCNQGVVGTYNVTPGSPATTSTLNPGTLKVNNSITTKTTVALYPASYSYVAALDAETIIANGTELIDAASMFNMPLTQQYNGADISQIAPMVAVETTGRTQLEFKNIAALLAITVKAEDFASVNSIKVSSDKIMNGLFLYYPKTGIFESLPVPSLYTDANKVTTLNCQNAGVNTAIPAGESKTFYVSIPPATYEYLQIQVTDGTKTKTMKTKAASITVARNMIYPITFKDNQTPAPVSNLLAGEFSVSATKKVKFTKGNLWCNTTTNPVTWAFETNQYDSPVGTDYTSDGTESGTWLGTHVGHFHWTKDVANSYTKDYTYESISNDDHFFADGSDAAHNLSVAGTEGLYVLTQSEWNYLFNPSDNENVRKGLTKKGVTVAGKTNCLIIAPDGYTGTIASSYSAAEWTTAEADGLVCLPAAGSNEGSGVPVDGGSLGRYYASDFRIRYYQVGAYYFSFNSEDLSSSNAEPYMAFAIRLVQTVDGQTDEAEDVL